MSYKLQDNGYVVRLADGAWIPPVADNADFRVYQDWLAKGNIPEPADPPPAQTKRFDLSKLTSDELTALKAMLVSNGIVTAERAAEL